MDNAQLAADFDVIFVAVGSESEGVYQVAKQTGNLAIGVDSNVN